MTSMTQKKDVVRSSKRVLILTLPIGENYGGILQAYALQTYVRSLGFDVTTAAPSGGVGRHWKRLIKKVPGTKSLATRIGLAKPPVEYPDGHFDAMERFISQNIETIPFKAAKHQISDYWAVIVGSDQVWREPYGALDRDFLAFVPKNVRRLSYAASFGVDNIEEYSWLQRLLSKLALRRFQGVSVRERSGVSICEREFGVVAEHHIDPTMLLDADVYRKLFDSSQAGDSPRGGVLSYVLDKSHSSEAMIQTVSNASDEPVEAVLDASPRVSVEEWIESIARARYVVTDSFHGTVFSILMHTPVIVLRNEGRGASRLESLVEMFGLRDRLISPDSGIQKIEDLGTIDWDAVDEVLRKERERARSYLVSVLG